MPHNYCYHSKKSKLIYFEFSSHCLVWLASRLEPAREPPPSRAEPDFLARKNSEPSRARLVHLPSRTEPSSARLVSSPKRYYGDTPEEDLIPEFRCLVRMDVLTGADPLTGVVLPCHVGAALAASRVGCATHAAA